MPFLAEFDLTRITVLSLINSMKINFFANAELTGEETWRDFLLCKNRDLFPCPG